MLIIRKCSKFVRNLNHSLARLDPYSCLFGRYFSANLMEPEECKKLMVDVSEFYGNRLDILVNNAGMQYVASLDQFPDEKWAQVIQLNLSSCFYTTKQGNINIIH